MPEISVVLPAYNAEEYIRGAIDSILSQTFTDFELIIINDASTDRTLEIIRSYSDKRIKVVNNETNLKLVATLNKGFDMAGGKFIARMDADDISYPDRFQKQVTYLTNNPDIDICGTWIEAFGSESYIHKAPSNHDQIKTSLLFINTVVHPTLMLRKESLLKHGVKFDKRFDKCEDYALWVQIIDKLRFSTIPEILLKYRIHGDNFSVPTASNFNKLIRWNCEVYKLFLTRLNMSYDEDKLLIHAKIGFKQIKNLPLSDLREYLSWLKYLVISNNKMDYFKNSSFQDEIIKHIIYISRNMQVSVAACIEINKALSLFPITKVFQTYSMIADWLLRKALRLSTEKYNFS